ncbi:class I SAM-dependent DNA methyltransferase [Burkholderia diffusa]|uniref:class I SAM-dependent DNA methyltransferase n=1 Tax=Burkholderia diffusa TaxID=488732 RepID=UPI001C2CC66C|nr:DNA methyltransferase [Burkholderia diffusa]
MGTVRIARDKARAIITPQQFIAKWSRSTLKERSAAQEHFIDLCNLLNEPTPAEVDPHGEWFCFERGATKVGGGKGWADVWRRHCFAWEYKGKHKDLTTAFSQLQRYAIALENPPLLVVCDMDRFEIHTNFTNTVHEVHVIPLTDLNRSGNLAILKNLFSDPDSLKPGQTKTALTEQAAARFAALAQIMRDRGGEPERVAHFLNRILFCLFAQDAKLLPNCLVEQVLEAGLKNPDNANRMLRSLFRTMKKGGEFGAHVIEWFNGSLFDASEGIPLEAYDVRELLTLCKLNWSAIEPSIFGTLFERGLDPGKRAQIGAHYTDPQSIMRIIGPVVIEPLVLKWETVKREIEVISDQAESRKDRSARTTIRKRAQRLFHKFLDDLAQFRVLDPACGSGNFLYLALQELKNLEHRATLEAEQLGLLPQLPGMHVGVQCVRGIESNSYAAELARVTVWIGELQWMLRHGLQPSRDPLLKPLETIECRDAVLNDEGGAPQWPRADVIVGNPPFLGNKRMIAELGEPYVEQIRELFKHRLPGSVDLVTYWFERAREEVESGLVERAGLVATQSIRKGSNRTVLDRIAKVVPIFDAWRDEAWVNEGAAVRVSLVAFGRGATSMRLDGEPVLAIHPDLTPATDANVNLAQAFPISANRGVAFQGPVKVGPFEIPGELARRWMKLPNPNGKSNSDVLRPWANGRDLTGRPSDTWIIDFGTSMSLKDASQYQMPFSHVQQHVKPLRDAGRREGRKRYWWRHGETVPAMRAAMSRLKRYIATPRVSKHRFFVWLPVAVLPDSRLYAICRDDDFTFGVLSSRIHEAWALANASRHGVGNDPTYNARNCFENFPFPDAGAREREAVSKVAIELDLLRGRWLHPSEWVDRINERGWPSRYVPTAGHEADVKSLTLTNLYNERPQWLDSLHIELDIAVAAAYGWSDYTAEMPIDAILARLFKLNLARAEDLFASPDRYIDEVKTGNRPSPRRRPNDRKLKTGTG